MTGKTHRQYSICFAYLAVIFLYKKDITQINYFLTIPIVLMCSKVGAAFPDLDHNWNNISASNRTVLNFIINTLISKTGGKHRSWQTHSIDILLWVTVTSRVLPSILYKKRIITKLDKEVILLLLMGFCAGWISHMISDMMTSAGVRLFCFSKKKIKFVPKKIGKLYFNTGNEWE